MSTAVVVPPVTAACPSWCRQHPPSEPGTVLHRAVVEAHGYSIEVDEEEGAPAIVMGEWNWMHLPETREYARALLAVCDDIEGVVQPRPLGTVVTIGERRSRVVAHRLEQGVVIEVHEVVEEDVR